MHCVAFFSDIDDAVVNPANRGARMGLEDQAAASASVTDLTKSMDYRTGYLMRKSTHELGGKKSKAEKIIWTNFTKFSKIFAILSRQFVFILNMFSIFFVTFLGGDFDIFWV